MGEKSVEKRKSAMSSHTPGPWRYERGIFNTEENKSGVGSILDAEDWFIARIETDGPNIEADTALIAAAPDLLEALEVALVAIETPENMSGAHASKVIRDAINKATNPSTTNPVRDGGE